MVFVLYRTGTVTGCSVIQLPSSSLLNYMSDKDMTLKELKKEIEQEKSFNINIDNIMGNESH